MPAASIDPGNAGLSTGQTTVTTVGKEVSLVAESADPGHLDRLHAGAPELSSGDLRKIAPSISKYALTDIREGPGYIRADLKTAGPDPWPDRCCSTAGHGDCFLDERSGQAAPAAMKHCEAARALHGDRQTIRHQDEQGYPRQRSHVSVSLRLVSFGIQVGAGDGWIEVPDNS